jgi:hypothetical protein
MGCADKLRIDEFELSVLADCNSYKLRESVQPGFQSRPRGSADGGNSGVGATFTGAFGTDGGCERQVE